jgi:GNAT superfamily N-acetyltransferase
VSLVVTSPRKLEKSDDRSDFSCGAVELDEWIAKYAWQNQAANSATTYVITESSKVIGYYAIAMSAYDKAMAPKQLSKGPNQIPCILLARLAVDKRYQGEGWGVDLLRDALLRSVGLSDSIGAAAVLIHCRDEAARDFYLRNGDFVQSPVEELHLMVPMKALKAYVDS